MRARILIGTGLAAALASALFINQPSVSAHGWGIMGGYGPGYHMGWGGGAWNCPAFGGGYGSRHQMRGPRRGYGPGMMFGYGYTRGAYAQGDLNLTTDQVKSNMERWLAMRGNPRLKVGEVKEKDANTITADIVTVDNSLVERFVVDRHTGFTKPDNG